jgi:hypothetical protein
MSLPTDFLDIINALQKNDVKFLVVGAFAMAQYGYVRATGDIDFLVECSPENSLKLISALKYFGAPLFGIDNLYFSVPGNILQIGLPPFRIDILTKIEGIKFSEAYFNKEQFIISGKKIPFLSLENLIKNKETNPREKDILDAKELKKIKLAEKNNE